DVIPVTPLSLARQHRVFHTGMAVAFLVTALVGFAPTYFLKPVRPSPPLNVPLHIHGLVFTSWLLLLTQSALVARRRVDLHKRLGIAGVVLAAAMIPLGIMTAVYAAHRGTTTPGMEPLAFMVFPVGAVLMFAGFFGAALWNRRKPEIHRRLILLATISSITPAISRWPWVNHRAVLALLLSLIFVLAGMIHDWKSRGRVHPLYLRGGLIVLLSGPGRAAIGNTAAWQSFARFRVE
ncbi:MAG: hypothetical protein HY736_22455, partial [Verrucomicrobia bacterium]|nr:hypothetical protein [Verrucomicrobiota bacterium]